MNKLPLITILTFLLCVTSAYAAPSFNIIADSVNRTRSAGQTLSDLSFTINNTGTTNLDINFTGYTLTKGSDQLSITSLSNITNIANGTSQSKTFSVIIPAQQKPGVYSGTLYATSNATPSTTVEDSVIININITPTYSVSTIPASEMNLGIASLNSTHTRNFTITNTGNVDITNVYFDFSESGFNLQADQSNFTLAFNTAETITFNITIPADYSTGNLTLGAVTIDSTELDRNLFNVKAEVGGGLIIEDLDVFLTTRIRRSSDGTLRSDSGSDLDVYDGRKLNFDDENIGPDSELRFNFNIENTFTDREDIDINDISVKITIVEIDDEEDIEEESNEFDLDSDSNEDVDVIFKIPLSVEPGLYDVIIEVQGEDDNANKHTAQMSLKIDIEKEARDVIVSRASVFPETIKCSGTSTLTATIKNIGKRIEENAMIEITNSDLNINIINGNIELVEDAFDFDNEFTKKVTINVDKNTKPGTYTLTVKSYLQEEILWETKTADLIVESCSQTEEEPEITEETDETETVETSPEVDGEETTESGEIPVLGPATTTEIPLTKKPGFWVAIILLNIAVIGGAVFWVVKVIRKK